MAKAPSTFSDVTVLRYKKGEQIIKQGDYGISIYIILNGNVEVSCPHSIPCPKAQGNHHKSLLPCLGSH